MTILLFIYCDPEGNSITPFKYGGTQKRVPPFKKGNSYDSARVGAFEFKYVPFAQRNASFS